MPWPKSWRSYWILYQWVLPWVVWAAFSEGTHLCISFVLFLPKGLTFMLAVHPFVTSLGFWEPPCTLIWHDVPGSSLIFSLQTWNLLFKSPLDLGVELTGRVLVSHVWSPGFHLQLDITLWMWWHMSAYSQHLGGADRKIRSSKPSSDAWIHDWSGGEGISCHDLISCFPEFVLWNLDIFIAVSIWALRRCLIPRQSPQRASLTLLHVWTIESRKWALVRHCLVSPSSQT